MQIFNYVKPGLQPLYKNSAFPQKKAYLNGNSSGDVVSFSGLIDISRFPYDEVAKELAESAHLSRDNFVRKAHYLILDKLGIPKDIDPKIQKVKANKIENLYNSYLGNADTLRLGFIKIDSDIWNARKDNLFELVDTIAHEDHHVLDDITIVRLIGYERYKKDIYQGISDIHFNKKFWNKILNSLGKIEPNSPDGDKASELYLTYISEVGLDDRDRVFEQSAEDFAGKLKSRFLYYLKKNKQVKN